MQARTSRPVGPARIIAFALVALAVVGLIFLHFATREDRVSVPAGAHAGQLTLKPATTAPSAAAMPPTAARWSFPRTATIPAPG